MAQVTEAEAINIDNVERTLLIDDESDDTSTSGKAARGRQQVVINGGNDNVNMLDSGSEMEDEDLLHSQSRFHYDPVITIM